MLHAASISLWLSYSIRRQGPVMARPTLAARILMRSVGFYQNFLSPLKMGPSCRFEPSCSSYALQAISQRGAVMGTILAVTRLAKCGPWHPGGYDPVPQRRNHKVTYVDCFHQ